MDRYEKNILISSNKYQKEYENWLDRLSGYEAATLLPYDFYNDEKRIRKEYDYDFANITYEKIRLLCGQSDYAIYILLIAAISYLLNSYTGQPEVLFGIPAMLEDIDKVNGILAFGYRHTENKSFKQLLLESKDAVSQAYKNKIYPLYHVFEALGLPLKGGEPLFRIIVKEEGLHGTDDTGSEDADLVFRFKIETDRMGVKLLYHEGLYRAETIMHVLSDLEKVIRFFLSDYNIMIGSIPVPEEAQRQSWKEKAVAMKAHYATAVLEETQDADAYVEPRNVKEHELAKIWEEILGIQDISIKANFFKLGGDSIKAIRMVAMLPHYKFSVKDIYTYSTIEQLSPSLVAADEAISQEPFVGDVPLSPIQRRFFETKGFRCSHYNQSLILHAAKGFDMETVRLTVEGIVRHHDMLRARYQTDHAPILQTVLPAARETIGQFCRIEEFDMANESDMLAQINEIQAGLDIQNGPLIKVACFHKHDGDHLLFVIHHLLTDGFSWRIILEDFAQGYNQMLRHEEFRLINKTHSYKSWVDRLIDDTKGSKLASAQEYWLKLADEITAGRPETIKVWSLLKTRKDRPIVFTQELTRQMQEKSSSLFLNMDHILLGCTALALKKTMGIESFVTDIEGHGRGGLDEEINIARTVGWFTSVYPVFIQVKEDIPRRYIEKIADYLGTIPNGGLEFGSLKYLSEDRMIAEKLDFTSDVRFNYLGEFDQNINYDLFTISDLDFGNTADPDMPLNYLLDITGLIIEKKLRVNFNYAHEQIDETRMNGFEEHFRAAVAAFLSSEGDRTADKNSQIYIEGIEPFNEVIYKDCFYNALFPVLQYYGYDRNEVLCNDVLIYESSDNGGSIEASYIIRDKLLHLLNNCGLKINRIVHSNDIISNVKSALARGRMAIIQIDCYYSPLREDTYKIEHWPHTLLIYGYDDELKSVYILEQSDKNSLDFKEQQMKYQDIITAYEGARDHFAANRQYPSYMDFGPSPAATVEQRHVSSCVLLLQHIRNHKKEIMDGLRELKSFIAVYNEKIEEAGWFEEAADRLYFTFQNISKAQHAQKYRLEHVLEEGLINTDSLNELVHGWRLTLAFIERYKMNGKYSLNSLRKTAENLNRLYLTEERLVKSLIANVPIEEKRHEE